MAAKPKKAQQHTTPSPLGREHQPMVSTKSKHTKKTSRGK
jgi:hypothetical protein